MGKLAALTVVLLISLAGVASAATPKSYVLKHPNREHCKADYVKKVETVKVREHHKTVKVKETLCVTTPTTTSVSASEITVSPGLNPPGRTYFTVSASVFAGNIRLLGSPITYTITDATTGRTVSSFTEAATAPGTCAVSLRDNAQGTVKTYTGEAVAYTINSYMGEVVARYEGCPLAPVSMPAADVAVFTGSFPGYSIGAEIAAPSVSKQEPF